MTEYDSVKVKDQLGRPEDKGLMVKRFKDNVYIVDGPGAIYTVSLGTAFVIGNPTKAVLGTNTLGAGNSSGNVLQRVVNNNNLYFEPFLVTNFRDAITSADWGITTVGLLEIANAEVAQSGSIAYGDQTINYATINIFFLSGSISTLTIEATADSTNWETLTLTKPHTFTNKGTNLKFKLTNTGTAVQIEYITIEYN